MLKEVEKGFVFIWLFGYYVYRVIYGDRGFCIINNEVIMVEYLRKEYKIKKIVIIDIDCYYGDGM